MQEAAKRKAGVVVFRRDTAHTIQVLLVSARRHAGSWVFPVGTVDPGETLAGAAARECMEESGYLVTVGDEVASVETLWGSERQIFTFFLARISGQVEAYETDRRHRWVTLTDLPTAVPDLFVPIALAAIARLEQE